MKKIKIKKKNKKDTSVKWLSRHLNDEYFIKSKKLGYRSRSAFKLIQIYKKFNIHLQSAKVLDLGAAPGGWSQVSKKLSTPDSQIIGIDILPIKPIKGIEFLKCDILEFFENKVLEHERFDIVLSDMAPNTSGHKNTDHLRIINLVEIASEIANKTLKKDCYFICKIFQGGAQGKLNEDLKKNFNNIKYYKPEASRKESAETYLIAKKK